MTKPKKAFAEMLIDARGSGSVDDICEQMSLMDIIYELKRIEKEEPVVEPTPVPPSEPTSVPPPELTPVPEPTKKVHQPSFWSRLVCDEDDEF